MNMSFRGRYIILSAVLSLTALVGGCDLGGNNNGFVQSSGAIPVDSVVDDLQGIVILCNVPDNGLDEDTRVALVSRIMDAESALLSGVPCAPQASIDEFLRIVQEERDPENPIYDRLYNLARSVFHLMATTGNWDCEGRDRLMDDEDARVTDPVVLLTSDLNGFSALFRFPEPQVQSVFVGPAGEEIYTELKLPGLEMRSGNTGAPSIPTIKRLIAVPAGHMLQVEATESVAELIKLKVYPTQPEPIDQAGEVGDDTPDATFFADRPFALDVDVYSTDRNYPAVLFNAGFAGQARDYKLHQIEVFCGQFNPVSQELELFDEVLVEGTFVPLSSSADPVTFVSEASFSPFESSGDLFLGTVLNGETVQNSPPAPQFPGDIESNQTGEEFIILTHPDFRDAADALAAWKNEKGILTRVFEAGTGVEGRETKEEIREFLDFRYETSIVRPSYVLFLGDAEFIEPWYFVEQGGEAGDMIGTDWGYARQKPTNEIVFFTPQFAVGRIPVDTPDQADTVVNKIIDYEQTPLDDDDFYNNVSLVGQFQCCRKDVEEDGTDQRTYIEVSERARHLLVSKGYTVERIYTRTIDKGKPSADPPVPGYEGDPTPRFIYSGPALPADIGPDSGFSYVGTTFDIRLAFGEGRFLILHRDHGSSTKWINPEFDTDDMDLVNNAFRLPVVFSINCTTGIFDNETSDQFSDSSVYFGEKLLRKQNGGAVGVIGDTRVSPSWANSAFTRGLFDAVWPDFIPSFGSNTSFRRLGDILNHAKLYLWTQIGTTGISAGTVINEMYLWHVLGDPTLEMWTANPNDKGLPLDFGSDDGDDSIVVTYFADGATITAFQEIETMDRDGNMVPDFVAIGRGLVEDGQAVLEHFQAPVPDVPIRFSASLPDAVSVELGLR